MEIALVLMVALLVFGPKKLPEIGRQLGNALRELRRAADEVSRSFNVDHEPDYPRYPRYDSPAYEPPPAETTSYGVPPADDGAVDLTDYTLCDVAGVSTEPGASAAAGASEGERCAGEVGVAVDGADPPQREFGEAAPTAAAGGASAQPGMGVP
jgi:sec-independent protein translocase protein TatA